MRIFLLITVLILTSCVGTNKKLNFPVEMEDIREVTLTRLDKESEGKFANIKVLTREQTKDLLEVLKNAKPVGPMKFIPDYYIVFTTKKNETRRIKINKNKIKGYEDDFSYEIEQFEFLEKF
ncbi:hypothetical protein [Tenacibaculum sp. 190524A02b]|uniref:hypothetical protein n=1 Tax=Tenacibaculum vairaonense TaxID=3137860 RepID=UPI0031FB8E07